MVDAITVVMAAIRPFAVNEETADMQNMVEMVFFVKSGFY
jgi:hypothetical protein